ncbi:MAG: tRNA (N6-isopentenyl adenosine(37)-C2)-methylthiotransferase MiaB [Myxococcota bacterium]
MDTKAKVFIETYGCQMNVADTELMGGILSKDGYDAAETMEEADVILINTCAVREKAEERVFGRLSQLLSLKHANPDLVLGVTGCMAEHLKGSIVERAPYVDLVVGPDAYRRLPELVGEQRAEGADPMIDIKLDKEEVYEGVAPVRAEGTNAWISVQRGCNKFCTFCIVPFTRGRERGVPPREILRQARDVVERGFREITLLGQTVNSYTYEDSDFADLLEALVRIDGLERIRFTSPYPIDFTPKLIETMATHDQICKYLHLPVQSGSNAVLKRMRRGYTVEEYRKLVEDIRAAMPRVGMSTDVIVGFPGETPQEYRKTYDLIEEVGYDFAYLFKYSERSGTFASRKLDDDIPELVKKERLKEVIALQERVSAEIFRGRVGGTYRVMVEGPSKRDPNEYCGRTDDFKMTVFPKPADGDLAPGSFVDVKIKSCTSHTLLGQIVA